MSKSLKNYFNKNVRVVDIDGNEIKGYVETYTSAIDSDEGVEEIAIKSNAKLIGITENEIQLIEIQ